MQEKIAKELKDYYKDTLKLVDWEERINSRLEEETNIGKKVVDGIINVSNYDLNKKTILIVGAGTGAELFYIHKNYDVRIYAIENYDKAYNILVKKAELYNLNKENILHSSIENNGFETGQFDLIVCFSVLEHVQDVDQAIYEMNRCLKKGGLLYLNLPNYAYPEEFHYKITTFPLSIDNGFLCKIHLKMMGRYTPFINTINCLSRSKLDRIFVKYNIKFTRKDNINKYKVSDVIKSPKLILKYIYYILKIPRTQIVLISKDK